MLILLELIISYKKFNTSITTFLQYMQLYN